MRGIKVGYTILVLQYYYEATYTILSRQLFVVVVTLSACIADEEPQASAAPDPILVHNDHYHRVEAHRLKEGLARLRGDLQRVVQEKRVRDEHRHERYRDERHRADHHDDGRWWEHRDERHDHDEPEGPVILRSIRPDEHVSRTYLSLYIIHMLVLLLSH